MSAARRLALIAGVLYLVTFVTSIPTLVLKAPVLNDPDFILGAGGTAGVLWAGWLEVILAFACIGTALAFYPVTRRHSEPAALGFLAARVLEAAIIVAGVIAMLSVVTLRPDLAGTAGADQGALLATRAALVAIHDWAFLLGQGLIPAINALLLGWVLYRTALVPRIIPTLGLVGAPLLVASWTAIMFGLWDQISVPAAIAAAPIIVWELSLGIWLVTKGFRPQAIVELAAVTNDPIKVRANRPHDPSTARPAHAPAATSSDRPPKDRRPGACYGRIAGAAQPIGNHGDAVGRWVAPRRQAGPNGSGQRLFHSDCGHDVEEIPRPAAADDDDSHSPCAATLAAVRPVRRRPCRERDPHRRVPVPGGRRRGPTCGRCGSGRRRRRTAR